MSSCEIVATHNGYGWTSTVPNQITCALLKHLAGHTVLGRVLDIGAGLGVGTLPLLETGAAVIANDLEASHLQTIQVEASSRGFEGRLEIAHGRFPDDLAFSDLDAIHCSNVLHFLRGGEIEEGARRMHSWLRPGGMIFVQVGTIYAGHIRRLKPLFEERRRQGVRWAGETECARDYVLADFREVTPAFMSYLDGPPLVEAFESAGFQTLRAWYYTRTGLPEVFRNDGREHFGYIGIAEKNCVER